LGTFKKHIPENEKEQEKEKEDSKKALGEYTYITYGDVWNRFSYFGSGLRHYGIKPVRNSFASIFD